MARMTRRDDEAALGLCEFVDACPSAFHTAAAVCSCLEDAGFSRLGEGDPWNLVPGSGYYVTRNNSSVVAFRLPRELDAEELSFRLLAAHGDSPTFKLKTGAELEGSEGYLRLDVEAYGGTIDHTWFDRPLSVAGRVLVRDGERVESRLVAPDRDLAIIPSLAVHLDRTVNESFSSSRRCDLRPLFSAGELGPGCFERMVATEAGCEEGQVLARDLFLVNRQPAVVWGEAGEFVSAPRLDDLMCVYVALRALVAERARDAVTVLCVFDNEEVGFNTKQGAMSTLLRDTLARVARLLGEGECAYERALARSMLVSCDNAHAVHPAHPELHDEANRCRLNAGIVVKEAANQRYCTDAFSRAVFLAACERAGVPTQRFANRSDMAGGSTFGNLSNMQVSMHAVDVGLPQLAMHSCFETAGSRDVLLGEAALRAFLRARIRIDGANGAVVSPRD